MSNDADQLRVGYAARIRNLTARPELNGRLAILEKIISEKGRWRVKIDGAGLGEKGEYVALKAASLEPIFSAVAVESNVEMAADLIPGWLSKLIESSLHASAFEILRCAETAGAIDQETAARMRAANLPEQSVLLATTVEIMTAPPANKTAMKWLYNQHEALSARIRGYMPRFVPTHNMSNDERHPGRAAQLGLPAREQLESDLAEALVSVMLHAEMVRSLRRQMDPATLESVGTPDAPPSITNVFVMLLATWHNRKHVMMHLAEWLECEGDFAAAEPLYAMSSAAARAAFRAGRAAPFVLDPNLCQPLHLTVALNNHALCHKRLGRYTRALPLYREAVAVFPSAAEAPAFIRSNLAKCEAIVNRPTRSGVGAHYVPEDYVPEDEKMSPGGADDEKGAAARERIRLLGNDAFRRGRYDEAIRMYSSALAADEAGPPSERASPAERATILCNRAAASLGHSDFHAAAEDAAEAAALDDTNAKAWYRLGTALRVTEGAEAALAALARAVACDPAWVDKVHALVADIKKKEASPGARPPLPHGTHDLGGMRFAETPLGRLDRLVGNGGLEALGTGGWARSLYESASLWHGALRDCQHFRSVGVDTAAEMAAGLPAGSAQALSDTGAGQMLFPVKAADVLRRLSDGICAVDEYEISCPLLVWLEGRHYNTQQTMHAINGLGEVLRAKGAIFDLGKARSTAGHGAVPVSTDTRAAMAMAPAISDADLVQTIKSLDLSDSAVCEKLELTLRHCLVVHYCMLRLVRSSDDGGPTPGGMMLHLLEWLQRGMAVRNLIVYNAHQARGGVASPMVGTREGGMPTLRAWAEVYLGDDLDCHADHDVDAIASISSTAGDAGLRLARMLHEPYLFEAYLSLAKLSLRMPDSAFPEDKIGGLESPEMLFMFASWGGRIFERDPRFFCYNAATVYDAAAHGRMLRAFEGVVPTFAAAHRLFARAAELAEESTRVDATPTSLANGHKTYLPALYLWEATNALAASNGDDGLGVELDRIRSLAARAEAAMESTRGLFGESSSAQTMVAVGMVLEATRGRLGSQKLQRAEHRRLTKAVLEGTPTEIHAALEDWDRKNSKSAGGKKATAKAAGLADTGPMWIPGAAPPPFQVV